MIHTTGRWREASRGGPPAAIPRIGDMRFSAMAGVLVVAAVAFAAGWVVGSRSPGQASTHAEPGSAVAPVHAGAGITAGVDTAPLLSDHGLVQGGPVDPRELIPLPGPGDGQGQAIPEECLPLFGEGELPLPGPGDFGPGGGPQELIPLEPVPRRGPGGPSPAPPQPRDPPGTLRTDAPMPATDDDPRPRGGRA
jgi:hypothetical protein